MIEAAEKNNVKRFIHISSTAVYGIPDHHPLYEDDKLDGVGPYGNAKNSGRRRMFEIQREGNVRSDNSSQIFHRELNGSVCSIFYLIGLKTGMVSR